MGNDIVDLIKQLELDNIYLLGHSMGGKVVMSILAEHPTLTNSIKGVIVCDVGCYDYSKDPIR